MSADAAADLLIFGWGNPSRGDDALGPLFVEHCERLARQHPEWGNIDFLTDFQLQVEHMLDLRGRRGVLFVDASLTTEPPFSVCLLEPCRDASFSSHAMSPQALLHTWRQLESQPAPPCWLLAIRGEKFELGEKTSAAADENLQAALGWVADWIATVLSPNQTPSKPNGRTSAET